MSFSYQKNFSNPTLPVDEAQFYALVRAGKWNENIDKFRETGDAWLKRKLPAFIFQATFDETTSKAGKTGAWRKQKATRLTGLVVMDVDHVENPREVFDNVIMKECKNEKNGILLVYITPSGKGLKIVFKARLEWGNLIDNQHRMAQILGVEVDESCKDASRMSFICKESDILYIDKELFTYENKEFAEKYNAEYRAGHSGVTQTDAVAHHTDKQTADQSREVDDKNVGIKWRGYDIQRIIDERYRAKLPCADDSNRHNESLKLASDLLVLFDGDRKLVQRILERQPWVQEIIE
ncbi:BT4734/BF3469 family protein, partial [Prevotella sp. P6B1]|uniref:BT4734/BF3469 family protein n=1 Tax=Prevotella sp. P6B1 TaxID=1410613 RepID=UPI00051C5986